MDCQRYGTQTNQGRSLHLACQSSNEGRGDIYVYAGTLGRARSKQATLFETLRATVERKVTDEEGVIRYLLRPSPVAAFAQTQRVEQKIYAMTSSDPKTTATRISLESSLFIPLQKQNPFQEVGHQNREYNNERVDKPANVKAEETAQQQQQRRQA